MTSVKCFILEDGCTSIDIALEVGKKIECLQVTQCQASSEEDKKLASHQKFRNGHAASMVHGYRNPLAIKNGRLK